MYDYHYDNLILIFRRCLYGNNERRFIENWNAFKDFYSYFKNPPDDETDNVMMCFASLLYFLGSHYFFQSSENWIIVEFGNLRIRRKVKFMNFDDVFESFDIIYQDGQKILKSTASLKKDKILILLPCHKIVMIDKNSINTFRYSTAKNNTDIKIMNSIRKSIQEGV